MRLISGVMQITYGTIIYAFAPFFHMNQHLFNLAIIGYIYVCVCVCILTTILILITIECLRSVVVSIISMSMIYEE